MKNFNHTPAAYSKVPQTDTDEDVTVHPPRLIHQAVAYLAAWEAIAATAIYYASDIDTFDLFFICAAFVPFTLVVNACCYGGAVTAISVDYPAARNKLIALVVTLSYSTFVVMMLTSLEDKGTALAVCFCGVSFIMAIIGLISSFVFHEMQDHYQGSARNCCPPPTGRTGHTIGRETCREMKRDSSIGTRRRFDARTITA